MGLGEMRIESQRGFELGGGAGGIAAEIQRGAELVMERRLARRHLDPAAKGLGGACPIAIVERLRAAHFVGDGALKQGIQLQHQGIRRPDLPRTAQPHVLFGTAAVAQPAIRERERIMDRGRARIDRERPRQVIDGSTVIRASQRRPAHPEQRRERLRLARQRFGKQRLGQRRLPAIEVSLSQPHQRTDIIRLKRAGAFEGGDRLRAVAAQLVEMAQIVWPARIASRQRLRIHKTRLRRLTVFGGHQQLAHLAVGIGEVVDRRRPIPGSRRQRGILLLQLPLNRRAGVGQIGKDDGPQRVTNGRRGRVCATSTDQRQRQHWQPTNHRPLPSSSVM